MKMMKRTLCLVLALVMLVGMFTVGASAQTTNPVPSGGEETAPTATVILHSNTDNDVAITISDVAANTVVNLDTIRFTAPDGKEFGGWVTSPTRTKPAFSGTKATTKCYELAFEKDRNGTLNLYVYWKDIEVSDPVTYTVVFKDGDRVVNTQSIVSGETADAPSDEPTKDGFTFMGWNTKADGTGDGFDASLAVEADAIYFAVWKEKPAAEETLPAGLIGSEIVGAIEIDCGDGHHDDVSFTYYITKESDIVASENLDGSYTYSVRLNDSDMDTIVAYYNRITGGKHTFVEKTFPVFTVKYVPSYWCKPGKWIVDNEAELTLKCVCDKCHDYCGGWFHNHTVTYTDGVKGTTVFSDITYEVKHGAKTPVPATPYRAGYKFAGWTPAVSAKTTKCVTYTATWTAVKAPALTTKHVAYLKGYGGGIVKPEGEITRAEAITMLYRLMDAASVKEYYTSYNAFTDVAKDAWYNDAVSTLANAGVLRYKTGLLNPNEKITRAEFFYMLTKFSNATYTGKATFVDVPVSYWAYEELALAQYLGWIKGYGGGILYPDDTITRAEVAASLNRVLGRTDCKTKDTKNYSDNPVNAWYYQDIVEASIAH